MTYAHSIMSNPTFAPFTPTGEINPEYVAALRKMTAAEKWEMMSRLYHAEIAKKIEQLRAEHSEWSESQLDRVARRFLLLEDD